MLTRALVFGVAGEEPLLMLVHLGILIAITVVGTVLTVRLVERRLVRG